ncbi:hypothetical protein FDP08_02260 [Marinobacter panjinensis]|uniref:Uncharacterized protein n=1 Tax=Marinobacter panjinensis TaxID=2576384 RepID=A0A4U6R0R1_9GAMM|nr:hypothetical protein [Marinobacter panjinensis]MCR8916045.1 hypothetical protein [Marinobacter panjinensis]TKV66993.1 hypothetical protein FDP08_02260 [Marinobacter panjinensis]
MKSEMEEKGNTPKPTSGLALSTFLAGMLDIVGYTASMLAMFYMATSILTLDFPKWVFITFWAVGVLSISLKGVLVGSNLGLWSKNTRKTICDNIYSVVGALVVAVTLSISLVVSTSEGKAVREERQAALDKETEKAIGPTKQRADSDVAQASSWRTINLRDGAVVRIAKFPEAPIVVTFNEDGTSVVTIKHPEKQVAGAN